MNRVNKTPANKVATNKIVKNKNVSANSVNAKNKVANILAVANRVVNRADVKVGYLD